MSQVINHSSLFGTVQTDKTALTDDTELRSGQDDPQLPPGVSFIVIVATSAVLWTGIFLLVRCISHLHLG
jgi:hypothetical protein